MKSNMCAVRVVGSCTLRNPEAADIRIDILEPVLPGLRRSDIFSPTISDDEP